MRLPARLAGFRGSPRAATLLTVLGGVVGQASLLVTGIIAARVLGVEDRGHLALLFLVVLLLSQLLSLGVPLSLTYELAARPEQGHGAMRVAATVCAWQSALVVVVAGGVLAALTHNSSPEVQLAALVSLPNAAATLVQMYALAAFQGLRQFTAYNVFRLLPVMSYAAAAGIVVVASFRSLVAITTAWTLSTVGCAAISAIVVRRRVAALAPDSEPANHSVIRSRMARFGATALIGSSSPVETLRVDQAGVGLFLTPADLGLYATAISLTNFPKFIGQSIGAVAYPYVAARPTPREATQFLWRFTAGATAVCGLITAILELAMPFLLPFFFGQEFESAVAVAQVLLLGAFLTSVRRVLGDSARGIGLPGAGSTAEVASWILLVPLLAVALPSGLNAVAWAIVGSSAASLLVLVSLVLASQRRAGRHEAERDARD